ncbi:hypothetical protein C4561_04230 [candidate division WWE3 bacterium]|jgi:tRNA dimethylallyltransferase|uniref:tRNA dimethylallyltransferase n=1 Tax=candidate division WWE3 bacterium TaxID=2053526 RepID=A0A3A4ZCI3_UNCKA|nr:MAG: hypothetical protein C4561_04230 [candidate division WWE3 bacterium]
MRITKIYNGKRPIPVIVGPTSSGKTSLALELAKVTEGVIISADSRQIYRGMDIGTGKLPVESDLDVIKGDSLWKLNGIEVWGYDLADPDEYFSAYDYAKFAWRKLEELGSTEKTTFIAGGTGFYADILTGRSKLSEIKPDLELRKTLENESLENLQKKLMSLNPSPMNISDTSNKVRLIRAIERELGPRDVDDPLPFPEFKYVYIGLKAPNDFLYKRADDWLKKIWHNGLIEEVESLIESGYSGSPKLQGLIYKSVLAYLNSYMTEEDAQQRAIFDLHAYVRRQLTWFKRNKNIDWFDISDLPSKEITSIILDKYLS